jgi:cell division protein FtsZ
MKDAFKKIDSVLQQGVKGIAELITLPGLINVDFADVRTIMSNAGTAIMGIGQANGEKRALVAMKQAIASPLLDNSIEGARGILFNVVGGSDLTMSEIDEAASIIQKTVDPDADIIFGAAIDETMSDSIKITLVATRFDESKLHIFKFQQTQRVQPIRTSEFKEEPIPQAPKAEEKRDNRENLDETDFIDDDPYSVPAFLRKK